MYDINWMQTLTKLCKGGIKKLKKIKRKLCTNKVKNKNKFNTIKKKIKWQERELDTMETTRYNQARRLDEINSILAEEAKGNNRMGEKQDENTDGRDSDDDDSNDKDSSINERSDKSSDEKSSWGE